MYKNNHFQKGISILIVFMLLAIPNIHIYSEIGSYQTSSSAITANKIYTEKRLSSIEKHDLYEEQVTHYPEICFPGKGAINERLVHEAIQKAIQDLQNNHSTTNHALSFKNKNYAKYDFSGFDN